MSIYATCWDIRVEVTISFERHQPWMPIYEPGDTRVETHHADGRIEKGFQKYVDVWCQAVPGFICYVGPEWDWLPPPIAASENEYCALEAKAKKALSRAVFICTDKTTKGTERNGQEYVNPLMKFTGAEYDALNFREMIERVIEATEELYEGTP